jgi:hypothetical protein
MSPRGIQAQAAEILSGAEREIDLQIDLREWDGITSILRAGGRWDCQERRWIGEGRTQAVWRVQPAEYEAAYWFADWFRAYARGERHAEFPDVYTLLLEGGRGAGKTDFGVRAVALMAVGMADRICWDISPVIDEAEELERVMNQVLSPTWYQWLKSEQTWRLWNGSEIQLLSGYIPSSLKRGRVDMWLMNEGQRFSKAAYMMARPRLADTSGLGIITANPPREQKGFWITEFHDAAQAGALPGIHLIEFDNTKNPTLDMRALEILRDEFGEDDYDREVRGIFVPIGDRVFYAWSPSMAHGNIRPAPQIGNITRAVTRRHFGREFDHVIGMDFQRSPYMAAAVSEFFSNPRDAEDPLQWLTDEAAVAGTEDDLIDELESKGYDPNRTALVVDASARWQTGSHKETEHGKGSWDILRSRGWKFIFPPDRKMKKNPLIIERVQATNARMCSARNSRNPYRRLYSVPENRQTNRALKEWDNRSGVPYRRSKHAHLCDAVSYTVWRIFPRRARRGKVSYQAITPKKSRRERDLDRI